MFEAFSELQARHREDAERERRFRLAQQRKDVRAVMGLPEGRRLLYRFINDDSGLGAGSHCGEQTHETAFREGRRALAITLNNELLRDCPVLYVLMMQEHLDALPTRSLESET